MRCDTNVPCQKQRQTRKFKSWMKLLNYVRRMYVCMLTGPWCIRAPDQTAQTRMDFHSNLRNNISSNRLRAYCCWCACVTLLSTWGTAPKKPTQKLSAPRRNRTSVRARMRDFVYVCALHVLCVWRNFSPDTHQAGWFMCECATENSAQAVRKLSRWQRGTVSAVGKSVGRSIRSVRAIRLSYKSASTPWPTVTVALGVQCDRTVSLASSGSSE